MDYSADLRTRLTSAVDNGRIDNWRVALDGFEEQPLHGHRGRHVPAHVGPRPPGAAGQVNDGHSLYLETLAELGVVGLVLLLVALGTSWRGGLARLGGPERHAHGAFVAGGDDARACTPAIDWDWEMPALFVWLFGAGGVALAARERAGRLRRARDRTPRDRRRAGRARAGITPALFALSQRPLDRAVAAFAARDCRTAIDAALDATERFGTRPEPWLILGYCDARLGQYALARRAMDAARSRDPDNWQLAYGQAIVYGVSGLDARPVRRARRCG